jgi:hypothetical protein
VRDEFEYLIKWGALTYDECTWECGSELRQRRAYGEVTKYEERERRWILPADKNLTNPSGGKKGQRFEKFRKQPAWVQGGTLHDYQLEGLNWLRFSWHHDTNVILADEMGLGKTIQSATFLDYLSRLPPEGGRTSTASKSTRGKRGRTAAGDDTESDYEDGEESKPAPPKKENAPPGTATATGPFIIVVPLSTVQNWERELAIWAPNLNVVTYMGNATARSEIRANEFHFHKKVVGSVGHSADKNPAKKARKERTGEAGEDDEGSDDYGGAVDDAESDGDYQGGSTALSACDCLQYLQAFSAVASSYRLSQCSD